MPCRSFWWTLTLLLWNCGRHQRAQSQWRRRAFGRIEENVKDEKKKKSYPCCNQNVESLRPWIHGWNLDFCGLNDFFILRLRLSKSKAVNNNWTLVESRFIILLLEFNIPGFFHITQMDYLCYFCTGSWTSCGLNPSNCTSISDTRNMQ